MFQRIHVAQKFNLKQQREFGAFLPWGGNMKDNKYKVVKHLLDFLFILWYNKYIKESDNNVRIRN